MQAPPEQLGAFYLGAHYDLAEGKRLDAPIIYDARDLTTHAVCVGMTGSGKTGLCISLLEEAALDRIPALIIDPKGDLTNLLLQFPDMRPEDFQPWINVDDARRKGQTVESYAQQMAETWRNGLADWGQGAERIRLLQQTTEYTIYTPGSDAGVPINVLGSLAAPKLDFDTNAEAIRERIAGTTAALLGLVGIDADPVRSREAILLSNIFEHFWRGQQDMDLAQLILSIQNPPVRKLGVFDVDTFFPEKDRFALAMSFNNLMASPSFQSWLTGEPLDVDRLYYTPEGKPRHAIFYLAHLSDSERMFFVTLLLEALVTWMRQQTGTTSLRALLYFDEIFGFFPPVSEPPSKRPLLTLLKQARAFGLGAVLVTQNPVDIDYKGLTNAGTWFIGKLQAERDKERVVAGLKGAIADAGRTTQVDYDALINQLGSRVFLLNNVHEDEPVVFQTRWALSYLRGPLTRPQVRQLNDNRRANAPAPAVMAPAPVSAASFGPSASLQVQAPTPTQPVTPAPVAPSPMPEPVAIAPEPSLPAGFSSTPPMLESNVAQAYLPVAFDQDEAVRRLAERTGRTIDLQAARLVYEPGVLGVASVRYVDRRRDIDEQEERILLGEAPSSLGNRTWEEAETLPLRVRDLSQTPPRSDKTGTVLFADVPDSANSERELRGLAGELTDWLYYNAEMTIKAHVELEIFQRPNESERNFLVRLQDEARQRRDAEIDKLEEKYQEQIDKLSDRLKKFQLEMASDEAEYESRKQQEILNIGETVFNLFMGRRSSRVVSTAASKRRMSVKAKVDIERTQQEIAEIQTEIKEIEGELAEAVEVIKKQWTDVLNDLSEEKVKPRRTDVDVSLVALVWKPTWLITYNEFGTQRATTIAAYPQPVDAEGKEKN
jgi:hypothetical protein